MDSQVPFLDQLFDAGLLIESGVDGLYARSGVFEDVIARFDALVGRFAEGDGAEVIRFPPGMNRTQFERSGYLKSFPQLAGTVHCFCGDEAGHADLLASLEKGEDWSAGQDISDVVLTPAACYPLYPLAAKRGPLPAEGRLFDIASYCFRREPSREPTRMQMFRMREYVRMGTPEQVVAFRETWMERGRRLISALELPFEIDVANDPFFGRAGRMLANNQRDQGLKFELLVPVNSTARPTACLSFNYHQDHFGKTWGLRSPGDAVAHTACVGFGMERVALALFRHHGLDPELWPTGVRAALRG